MPERWEREIGRLGTLTAPLSTPGRIGEGPHGDGMPPPLRRGRRVAAVVVAFSVFGAAAVFVAGAFREHEVATPSASDDGALVVRLSSSDEGPSASLRYHDQTTEPQFGSYCWNGTTKCVDTALMPFRAEDFVEVPTGTPIAVVHDGALDGSLVWTQRGGDPNDVDLGLINAITTIEGPPGRYVLAVSATWPLGQVQYYFPIDVVAAPSATASSSGPVVTATLEAPAEGSMPGLVIAYRGQTQRFVAHDGRWPGVDGFDLPLQLFDTSIDPGSAISITTDADRIEGTLFIADRDQRETGESIPLDLTSGSATLPESPGYFRLVLVGSWPEGEVGFNVGITIGTPTSDWPPASPTATVPDTVGLSQHDAVVLLKEAGFASVSVATPAGQVGGAVTSQDPQAGTVTERTTTIRLTVGANG